ncbi:MAG: Gfo/Idh/MocA family oxidoreductase, partial [Rhodothermales bacterium]
MGNTDLDRRRFLATGGAAAAGAVLGSTSQRSYASRRRSSNKIRLALVGTGIRGTSMWGRDVVRNYSDVAEFVGLSDINPGRLEYGREYIGADCPTYVDFDQMMREQEPDMLIVTTMDSTHHEFIIKGLEAGADVVTEKPMTTDDVKCRAILDAERRSGKKVIVTFNYRYSPNRARMKEMLMNGRIGEVTSVDFHWYLDIYHGASYFRRWHGQREYGGTLLVHKATHHFDLMNWWLDSEPETVYAQGALEHYGTNNPFRSTNCRGCPHQDRCDFYMDITQNQRLMDLYVAHEEHDGYLRDGCLWREDINIYDKMGVQARYANGVQLTYSLTTYSPYEGYRIAFNGTEGRLEAWIKERQPWEAEDYDEIRVTDNFGETELIRISHAGGGHGGGDVRLMDRVFREPDAPDPLQQSAGSRDGAMSILLGIAARKSIETGQPVNVASLTDLQPRAVR